MSVVHACLQGAPRDETLQALRAMGVAAEAVPDWARPKPPEPVAVWPENWHGYRLFAGICTQWRMGGRGPIGLDYAAIPIVEQRERFTPRQRREAWPVFQDAERIALQWFADQAQE